MTDRLSNDWLTVSQASQEKQVSEDGIRAACREGRLKAARWGRTWMIHREDLKQWEKIGHRPKKQPGKRRSKKEKTPDDH